MRECLRPVQVSTVCESSTITAARFWCNGELLFLSKERKGLVNISSVDTKISWYFSFSTSPILALASDVAVNPIEEGSNN